MHNFIDIQRVNPLGDVETTIICKKCFVWCLELGDAECYGSCDSIYAAEIKSQELLKTHKFQFKASNDSISFFFCKICGIEAVTYSEYASIVTGELPLFFTTKDDDDISCNNMLLNQIMD